jgi:hypothetical protein
MTTRPDHWTEGYRAARDHGASYSDNPHQIEPAATAWAFGASEGMKARNHAALARVLGPLRKGDE